MSADRPNAADVLAAMQAVVDEAKFVYLNPNEQFVAELGAAINHLDRLTDQFDGTLLPADEPAPTEARARIVAEHWRDRLMALKDQSVTWAAHPLAMVLAALAGETDPAQCGVGPGPDADAFTAVSGSVSVSPETLEAAGWRKKWCSSCHGHPVARDALYNV